MPSERKTITKLRVWCFLLIGRSFVWTAYKTRVMTRLLMGLRGEQTTLSNTLALDTNRHKNYSYRSAVAEGWVRS